MNSELTDEEFNLLKRFHTSHTEKEIREDIGEMKMPAHVQEWVKAHAPWDPEIPNDDVTIRRYVNFSQFASILEQEYLWFTQASNFSDHFEGTFAKGNKGVKHQIYEYEERATFDDTGAFEPTWQEFQENWEAKRERVAEIREEENKQTYINCWRIGSGESAIFWDAYIGKENGVAIETTVENFKESLKRETSEGQLELIRKRDSLRNKEKLEEVEKVEKRIKQERSKVQIGEVEYVNFEDAVIPDSRFGRFFHKNNAFSDENEFRAVVKEEVKKPGIEIAVKPTQLISSVILAPDSKPWFENLVKETLHTHDIDAEVRNSKLDNDSLDHKEVATHRRFP